MKVDGVKDKEKANKAGKPQVSEKKGDDLEPCTSPHTVEAHRFDKPDEACDDGVN
jgi:hypothetical protein